MGPVILLGTINKYDLFSTCYALNISSKSSNNRQLSNIKVTFR